MYICLLVLIVPLANLSSCAGKAGVILNGSSLYSTKVVLATIVSVILSLPSGKKNFFWCFCWQVWPDYTP